MSNQIFANDVKRYYPCPGMDVYPIAGDQTIVAGAETAVLYTNPALFIQSPGYQTVFAGAININADGIYTLSAQVGITHTGAADNDRNVDVKMNIGAGMYEANGETVSRNRRRLIWQDQPNEYQVVPVSYTGYLRAGSFVNITVGNYEVGATRDIIVLQAQSILVVCKIA